MPSQARLPWVWLSKKADGQTEMLQASDASVHVFLSLGSNIAPENHLRMAYRELAARYGHVIASSVYRTPPVGFDGDDFLNMVVGFTTAESPASIRNQLEALHRKAGRKRLPNPFSPRSLDIDMLLVGDVVSEHPRLPHADIEKYAFVLGPLAELAPEVRHPVNGQTISDLWQSFDQDGCSMQKVQLDLN